MLCQKVLDLSKRRNARAGPQRAGFQGGRGIREAERMAGIPAFERGVNEGGVKDISAGGRIDSLYGKAWRMHDVLLDERHRSLGAERDAQEPARAVPAH